MPNRLIKSNSWNLTTLKRRMSQVPYALIKQIKRESPTLRPGGFGLNRRLGSLIISVALLLCIYFIYRWGTDELNNTTIIVITPTHKRPERFADLTRFSQTLMHVKNVHWVVIEDANSTIPAVERILQRSRIPYTYFYTTTKPGFPRRGWTHRNMGLEYIRKNYRDYKRNAVVYFADDDNSYDIRLFNKYIRRVKTIGIWAVGLAAIFGVTDQLANEYAISGFHLIAFLGGALVEAPHVENGTITKWDVLYAPNRKFATDMAGFAVNLKLILGTNASFHQGCVKVSPESCFLVQFQVDRKDIQPFGYDDDPKELLVWHTKTKNIGTSGGNHGYITEK